MKKQNGITLVALTITIVVMIILAGITTYVGTDLIREVKLQDLITNMLLIQAEAKKGLEEVSFQTANLDETNDADKINTIKSENLKGTPLSGSEAESDATETGEIIASEISEYYYLDENTLEEMGLKDVNSEDVGYFIVKYDIDNIFVEVLNTKGYKGNYTLTQLEAIQGEQ